MTTTDLLRCLKNQNKNDILELLEMKDIDISATSEGGDTALHLIFQNANLKEKDIVKIMKRLLDGEVDFNAKNEKGTTVLHLAISQRSKGAVDLLLGRNADIITREKQGVLIAQSFVEGERKKFLKCFELQDNYFLLPYKEMMKMMSEGAKFVKWLIKKGCDFNCGDETRPSALHLSIEYNLHHVTLKILKNSGKQSPKAQCADDLLNLFIRGNGIFKKSLKSELMKKRYNAYSSCYNEKLAKMMLDDIDVTEIQKSLQEAIMYDEDINIMNLIILKLVKSNLANSVLIVLFRCAADWEKWRTKYFLATCRKLINQSVDVNLIDGCGISFLHYAVLAANRLAVECLASLGANFNSITSDGENLFHALATEANPGLHDNRDELLDFLVRNGCNSVNEQNKDGNTALHLAFQNDNLSIARKLLEYGAIISCKNKYGQTPLHLIKAFHNYENQEVVMKILELLQKSKANVNVKDCFGKRPLDHAVSANNEILVPVLLHLGAYINIDFNGVSPFYEAIRLNSEQNVRAMLAYGADINDSRILELIRNSDISSVKILLFYCVKLQVATLPYLKEYVEYIKTEEFHQSRQDCINEVEKLKGTLIATDTSIYNFLHMGFDRRSTYLNVEDLKNLVNSTDLEEQFPQYFCFILNAYHQTLEWKSLLKPAEEAWKKLTKIYLPELCIERIFGNLQVEDLVTMIEHHDEPANEDIENAPTLRF